MKKLGVLLIGVISLLMATVAIAADTYVVQAGDTLWSIAKKNGVSPEALCTINSLSDCNKIRIGQEIRIGDKAEANPSQTATPTAKEATASNGAAKAWKRVGTDPVLPEWVRKSWLSSDEVSLDPRQEAKLRLQGLDDSQIAEVKQSLKERKYQLVFRPIGYSWESMAFGSGVWSKTSNETGDDVPVFAIAPTSGGFQVDLALGCGNTTVNNVDIRQSPAPRSVVPTPQQKAQGIACERIGAFWAQITEHGTSGTARLACLFQIDQHWKIGPTVGVGGSRFDDHTWVEIQNFAGAGFELRGKNITIADTKMDAVEFVVMVGSSSASGQSADELTRKLKSSGLDLQLAVQLRKQFKLSKETAVTVRFMPFANIPLTGKEADILWNGMLVKQENGRHVTVGMTLRFEVEQKGLGFKPELTLGLWRISDIDNPLGGKILAGASTLDGVWRIGAGVQFPGPIWVVEIEWNPAWGWLQLNGKKARETLHAGAKPTCEVYHLKTCSPRTGTHDMQQKAAPTPREVSKTAVSATPETSRQTLGWNQTTRISSADTAYTPTPPVDMAAYQGFNQK